MRSKITSLILAGLLLFGGDAAAVKAASGSLTGTAVTTTEQITHPAVSTQAAVVNVNPDDDIIERLKTAIQSILNQSSGSGQTNAGDLDEVLTQIEAELETRSSAKTVSTKTDDDDPATLASLKAELSRIGDLLEELVSLAKTAMASIGSLSTQSTNYQQQFQNSGQMMPNPGGNADAPDNAPWMQSGPSAQQNPGGGFSTNRSNPTRRPGN